MAKVTALRDFRNANIGAKSQGDEFEYDLGTDPEMLKPLGLVAGSQAKVAEEAKK